MNNSFPGQAPENGINKYPLGYGSLTNLIVRIHDAERGVERKGNRILRMNTIYLHRNQPRP